MQHAASNRCAGEGVMRLARRHSPSASMSWRSGHQGGRHLARASLYAASDRLTGMETEATRPPDDEHLARLLAAAIVADLRRFPPVDSWDIIGVEVKSRPPEPAA